MLKAEIGNTTVYYTRGFELISRREGTTASYYVYDGGLSVRALTNEASTVTDTIVFDAFGNETGRTGTTDNPYGFQGEEQDATGLYYLRARYMDPAAGTFTTMDTYGGSLSDPMSLHKYLFANSNPVMYSDPSGHFSLVEFELSEAIDEILMSSISFGMAYLGMVNDNPNMSDTEKFTGYLAALGLGALFPFGIALLNAMVSIIVAGYVLAGLSLVLTVTSSGIDHDKHPTVGALLDITAGATWGASLSYLGLAFTQNARKSSELIHLEADNNATGDGCNWDDVNQEIDDWYCELQKNGANDQTSAQLYQVGPYGEIKGAPGLDAHHVGQKALMKTLVNNYDPNTAPAINVPQVGHTKTGPYGIVSRSTKGITNVRQLIARDILELRRVYPDIPNSALRELIDMNYSKYPEMRWK